MAANSTSATVRGFGAQRLRDIVLVAISAAIAQAFPHIPWSVEAFVALVPSYDSPVTLFGYTTKAGFGPVCIAFSIGGGVGLIGIYAAAFVLLPRVKRWAGYTASPRIVVSGTSRSRNTRGLYALNGGKFAVRFNDGGALHAVRIVAIEHKPDGTLTEKLELCGDGPLLNESQVVEDIGQTIATRSSSPNFLVGIGHVTGGILHPTAIGWRHGDHMMTAAHAILGDMGLHNSAEPVVFNLFDQSKVARLDLSPEAITGYRDFKSASCTDMAGVKVPRDSWAVVGVKGAKATNYSHQGEGLVHIWGHPAGYPLVNTGVLVKDLEAGRHGLLHHKVNTEATFSGSPICRKVSGVFVIVGMHICGDKGGGFNTGVSSWTVLKMKRKLGLLPTIVDRALDIICESKEPRELQPYPDEEEEVDFEADWYFQRLRNQRDTEYEKDYVQHLITGDGGEGDAPPSYSKYAVKARGRKDQGARKPPIDNPIETWGHRESLPVGFEPLHVRLANSENHSFPVSSRVIEHINRDLREYETDYDVAVQTRAFRDEQWERPRMYDRNAPSISEIMGPLLGHKGKEDVRAIFQLAFHSPKDVYESPEFSALRSYVACGDKQRLSEEDVQRIMVDGDDLPCFKHVATADVHSGKAAVRKYMTSDQEAFLKEHVPEYAAKAASYVWPPQGYRAVEDSMQAQAKEQKRSSLEGLDSDRWIQFLEKNTPFHYWAPVFSKYRSFWMRMADGMDKDKSSGWTKEYKAGPKRAILEDPEQLQAVYNITLLRLGMIVCCGYRMVASMSPMEIVERGLGDPSVVSVKAEAHADAKAQRKAWRLIWAQSLVDSFVRLTTSYYGNKQDMICYKNGSINSLMGGLGHHDDGIKRIGTVIDWLAGDANDKVRDRDTAGWDLGVTRDAIMLVAARRADAAWLHHDDMCTSERGPSDDLKRSIQELIMCNGALSSAHVLAVGSSLYESCRFGQTDTGTVDTTAQNTFICAATAHNAGADRVACVGDDLMFAGLRCSEEEFNNKLAAWGMRLKNRQVLEREAVDFTSHLFRREAGEWKAEFDNVGKMFAHLMYRPPGADIINRVSGCAFALRHSPRALENLRAFALGKGWLQEGASLTPVEGEWES